MENKIHTLRRQSDFINLKNYGKRIYIGQELILNFCENKQSNHRFGWTIPGKVANAVARNRIKRWCRDYFRTKTFGGQKYFDINVIVRQGKNGKNLKGIKHQEFIAEMDKAIEKVR